MKEQCENRLLFGENMKTTVVALFFSCHRVECSISSDTLSYVDYVARTAAVKTKTIESSGRWK